MPGIITNMHLAGSTMPGANPDVWLGAALPDFRALYRDARGVFVHPGKFLLDEGLTAGSRLHGLMHTAHQGNLLAEELRLQAQNSFLEDMAFKDKRRARAYAEVATDLLLDGIISLSDRPNRTIRATARRLDEPNNAFSVHGQPDFVRFVRGYFERRHWENYRDPATVAEFITRRFAARRHEQLDVAPNERLALEEMVREQKLRLEQVGGKILGPTRQQLASKIVSLAARE